MGTADRVEVVVKMHGLFACTQARFELNVKRAKKDMARAIAAFYQEWCPTLGCESGTQKHWLQFSKKELAVVLGEVQP